MKSIYTMQDSQLSPYCIVVKVLDWDFRESEFKIQLLYYIHFWTNTLSLSIRPDEFSGAIKFCIHRIG